MTLKARITKYTKRNPSSPGWFTAAGFIDIRDGRAPVPAGLTDMTALERYVSAWRQLQVKMLTAPGTLVELYTDHDAINHFTVMVFASSADLQAAMLHLRADDTVFQTFIEARNWLAEALQVNITTYPEVDLAIEGMSDRPDAARLVVLTAPAPTSAD